MEGIVEAVGLTKVFGKRNKHPAVAELELSIPEGQLFGLVGPDGAGKTTTIRILSTVMLPTSGSCRVAGLDLRRESEKARPFIGYMPQQFSLYPDLSVIENLTFFANLNQVPSEIKDERITEMLAFTRLERFRTRRARQLSGGMQKKLALACALVHGPKVLLLDEPSTGVDPVSRRELWVMLGEVVRQGVTILVSTPYMDEADRCDAIGMIYEGRLLTQGSPADLQSGLPFTILEVKARPRKTMRSIVEETPGIIDWRPVGDRLRLAVPNQERETNRIMRTLGKRFQEEKLDIRVMRKAKRSMEDVFVHLVSQQRSGA